MFFRRINGFSLIELLIVLAITAILLLCSWMWLLPNSAKRNQQIAVEQLQSQLVHAKLLAYQEHHAIVIHPVEDNWARNWELLLDKKVVAVMPAMPEKIKLKWQGVHQKKLTISPWQHQSVLAGELLIQAEGVSDLTAVLSRNGDVRVST